MESKEKNKSLKDFIYICLGLIVILLSGITITGKTFIGSSITYALAFLFGMLYPFIIVLFVVFGLYLVIARRHLSFLKHRLTWVGSFLLALSILAFASYSIYTLKDGGIDLSSLNNLYNDRFSSFASSPFSIDSISSMSLLGGGYIGLFFLALLGSIWGYIGDAIFFSFLLIISILILVFRPEQFRKIKAFFKERKEKKISYSSPYKHKKDNSNPFLNRSDDESSFTEVNPVDNATFNNKTIQPRTESTIEPRKQPQEEKIETPQYENPFSTTFQPTIKPMDSQVDVQKKVESMSTGDYRSFTVINDNSAFDVIAEPNKETFTDKEEIDDTMTERVNDFARNATGKDSFTIPVLQEETPFEEEIEEKQNNYSNSANQTYQAVQNQPQPQYIPPVENQHNIKQNEPVEFKVNNLPKVEETKPVQPTENEDDIIARKEQAYFAMKQKRASLAMVEKKRKKDEKIQSLMKYVSDVPKTYSYPLPTDVLLEEIDDSAKVEKNTISAQEKAQILNKVLDEFNVKATATSFTIGASVTRFNVETQRGEKADKIATLTSEFQRALNGDMSVRVETVVEGRSTSGIEVGNVAPMAVSFKDMFEVIEHDKDQPLLLPIGKDISGNIITFPLNKMPHMLVAGTTGSGKSVLIHSMIMTIIMRTYPNQVKLMLIDPKQVEFVRYQEESHLFCPVISKPESAILALKKLCDEMDRRFTVLSKCRVANLEEYNDIRKIRPSEYESMPYIVTVIDEFADLMQTGGNEVTRYVTRIAQKARACGIHLIIATQRPSKDNVPMIIKANVPCRIGLSCSSQIDSRVILDENGAETLLGKGDLLFKCPGKKSLIRAQSPFISPSDMNVVLQYVIDRAGDPQYDQNFLDLDIDENNEEESNPEGDLYSDVKEFVSTTGITSKTSIMRSFQISSLKADQFLSRLQSEGIVLPGPNGKYTIGPAANLEDFK